MHFLRSPRPWAAALTVAALTMPLAACGYHSSSPARSFLPAGSTAPRGSQHLWIADNLRPVHVYIYRLPLTASSQPRREIETKDAPGSLAFGPGQAYITYGGLYGSNNEGILVYEPRKRGAISFLIAQPDNGALEVNAANDLFQGQTHSTGSQGAYQINVFKAPLTPQSKPAFTMNTAVNHRGSTLTRGMAFDLNGNLWIKDDDHRTMDKYAPPFSAKSVPKLTFSKGYGTPYGYMIFDRSDVMYVTDGSGIDVYDPPFGKNAKKAFVIKAPSVPDSLAIDAAGNLYAMCGNGNVYVYMAPLNASSSPHVTMPVPGKPNLGNLAIRS